MLERENIGRNRKCPCGSGKKYKKCCFGKNNLQSFIKKDNNIRNLSVRERNLLFLERIAEALQFNKIDDNWQDIKAACTPDAVKKIHEAIIEIWPLNTNIRAVLGQFIREVSGIYIGDYTDPSSVEKGIVRQSLYSDKIIIIDPFLYPTSVRNEYNPILNPTKYRTTTLRNIHFWFRLTPWINAGLVEIVRSPCDFDHKLQWESMKRQREKYASNVELKNIADDWVKQKVESVTIFEELLGLHIPDSQHKKAAKELFPNIKDEDVNKLLSHIKTQREKHPFYLEPIIKNGCFAEEIHTLTSGTSYDMAKLMAEMSGAYLITDMPAKWKEIEIDRKEANIDNGKWSPFAKALQGLSFKYLDNIDLNTALKLRKDEGRLEDLRLFLRQVWTAVKSEEPFDDENIINLASELHQKIREAEEEWKNIDRDLIKWFGSELAAGILGGQLISTGNAVWMAAAIATAGITNLFVSQHRRQSFPGRFPAAFFMDLRKKSL
ncbi:MAG: SEC-C domain-containing protein [Planctomycetes bacterium]|nr:SEC-C domain-containing protein [Planctomycetota bacterium]